MERWCVEKLEEESRKSRVEEVKWHTKVLTFTKSEEVNQRHNLINLDNGLYNWIDDKLLPHDPDYLCTQRIPVAYAPNAKCPNVDYFFDSTIPKDCIPMIEEAIGYCLIPDSRFEKAWMFLGEGRNGKSTLLKLIIKLLGDKNVSKIPLHEIINNRFKRAELFGKLVNIFVDLNPKALEDTGYFKAIVSGDPIDGERKFKDPFDFMPYSRMLYSANQMPRSLDRTPAFYRRWYIIPFTQRFEGKKADRSLIYKLTTSEELSGLLNRGLAGLRRLMDNETFTESQTVIQELLKYKTENDSVVAFVEECCVLDDEHEIARQDLYEAYHIYCEDGGLQPTSRRTFYTRLKLEYNLAMTRKTQGRYICGITVPSSTDVSF
jgi:putative DNA primase/helicase